MDSPANRLEGLLTLTKRKQPETSSVPRELTETHLILYVAWRKLWMERDSATAAGGVFSLSLGDLHRAVTTEASELAIDQLRLCSVVPDWTQMIAVVRMLSRRGVLRLHKYTSKGKPPRLHVVMSNQAGEDMLNSINAAILDQLDATAPERSHKHPKGAKGNSSKKPPLLPRKKVYQIPACVLELHLEYERRDIIQETQAATTTTPEKKSSSV